MIDRRIQIEPTAVAYVGRFLLSCLIPMLALQTAEARGAEAPHTVSPGESSRRSQISSPCPTFTWTEVNGAPGYELVVYRLLDDSEEPQPVLWKTFAGSVDGWTPSLEDCLRHGERYAWSVRIADPENDPGWAMPRHFEVAAGPRWEWLENALEDAELLVARGDGAAGERITGDDGIATASPPGLGALEPAPALAATTEIEMSIEGGVEAVSFFGDGSALTALDPGSFLPGTAYFSVLGSSGTVDCLGCVLSQHIGNGQVREEAIGVGEVKGIDIDPATVQARVDSSCDDSLLAIQSVGNDGSATCETSTRVEPGVVHQVSNFNGGSSTVSVARENRLCFLTYVSFRDVDDPNEDAYCAITLSSSGPDFWVLTAASDNNADARCGMRCIEVVPSDRTF